MMRVRPILTVLSLAGAALAQVAVPNSVMQTIGSVLPERSNAGSAFLSAVYTPNLLVEQVCTAEIIFIWEGAGYRNSLGYFTYVEDPNGGITISSSDLLIANMSFPPQGSMQTGDVITLRDEFGAPREFQPGERIGFFLIANGFGSASSLVTNWEYSPGVPSIFPQENAGIGLGCYTTLPQLNREAVIGDGSKSQHVAMMRMPGVPGFLNGEDFTLVGFEDLNRTAGSDDDFNDAVFLVRTTPESAISTSNLFQYDPDDVDGDGVAGLEDHFPNDPERAYLARFPNSGEQVLAFEDNYPQIGDADYNDAVIAFHYVLVSNADGDVKDILADYHLVARGAAYDHLFGLHLPGLPAGSTGSVQIERFLPSGSELVQRTVSDVLAAKRRIPDIFESTKDALPPPEGWPFTNVFFNQPQQDAASARLRITFDDAVDAQQLGSAPYDPYLGVKRYTDEAWDLHLVGKPGFDDRPTLLPVEQGAETFLDGQGYPYALLVPTSWRYPLELQHIEGAYPQFDDWRLSSGGNSVDWYLAPVGGGGIVATPLTNRIPARNWTLTGPAQ